MNTWKITPNIDRGLSSIPSDVPTSYVASRETDHGTSTVEFSGADDEQLCNEFVRSKNETLQRFADPTDRFKLPGNDPRSLP